MTAHLIACREKGWLDFNTDNMQWSNLTRSFMATYDLIKDFSEIVIPDGYKVVVMDETGDVRLQDFQHPENAVYIFGRSTLNIIQTFILGAYNGRNNYR